MSLASALAEDHRTEDGACEVLSFDADGRRRYIEVKTTALGARTPFYISSAELEFARTHRGSFALHRVYDVLEKPHFYVLEGDIAEAVDLVPTTYRAQLKSSPERARNAKPLPSAALKPSSH